MSKTNEHESVALTVYDHRNRMEKTHLTLHIGTIAAIALVMLGVSPIVCVMIPSALVGIPTAAWVWRDLRTSRRRHD